MNREFATLASLPATCEPGNETQRRITRAALDLFAKHGFDGATTEAIARRAKVTEKTLFRHYGSKKRLFAKTVYPCMLRMLEPLAFESLRAILQTDSPSLSEVVHAIMSDRVAFNRQHPETLKLLAQGLLLHPDFREAFAHFWRSKMLPDNQRMLRRLRRSKELRSFSDGAVLRSIISLTAGFAFYRLLFDPRPKRSDRKEIEIMVEILLHGISAPVSRRRTNSKRSVS